jgi:RNA polymerase sigma-70 factor, ECF subfamily
VRVGPESAMSVDCCDQTLVLRAQSGERGAFNVLVRRYRRRVMRLSMRYISNRADAEDAVQNTFLKAYWGLKYFRGDAAFYSWLHRIAVNSAKTMRSHRARDARVLASEVFDGEDWGASACAPMELDTPEGLALEDEICAAVNAAIAALCDEQQTAIILREFHGLSYQDVASAMSCPIGTVRSRVSRAREAIDRRLREVCDGKSEIAPKSPVPREDRAVRRGGRCEPKNPRIPGEAPAAVHRPPSTGASNWWRSTMIGV